MLFKRINKDIADKIIIVAMLSCFLGGWGVSEVLAENKGQPGKVLVDSLNLRKQPSKSGSRIKYLNKEDKIIVLEAQNGWLKIIHQGRMGYVKNDSGYVTVYAQKPENADSRISAESLEGLVKKSENLNSRIEDRRSKIKTLTQKEKEIFDDLDDIDNHLNQVRLNIQKIKTKMNDLSKKIQTTKASIPALEKKIKEHKDYADKRIVALYKIQRLGGMAHVSPLNENIIDLIRQKNSFERILKKDQAHITQYAQNIKKLDKMVKTQKEQKDELEDFQTELSHKQQEMSSKRNKRAELLSKIQNQKQLEQAAHKMLAEAARNLDKEIKALSKSFFQSSNIQPSGKDSFEHLKGLLNMPVKGKVISRFGSYKNPRNNITLYRNGIDIRADRGEPVRAVFAGKVLFAKWFKGYGNMMIIDHGNHYYSVYANIEELFKSTGDVVREDEVIATVGDTGSLKGPKLYFEIRYFGKPQDPLDWIQTG